MIIRNSFNINKHNLNKNNDYLQEEKKGLIKSIDNLDERYKNGEIDFEKFKELANNYAKAHEDLNQRINKSKR